MTMLDERLRALGDVLDIDADDGLPDAVLARLDERPTITGRPLLRIAAALVVVLALVAVAVPSSRRTVADWLGFDGVRLDRRPGAPPASVPDPVGSGTDRNGSAAEEPGPVGTVVEVGDDEILVSEFVGTLDNPAIGKIVGDGTRVRRVDVGGGLGLWIDGAPHDVTFFDAGGEIVLERFAGNTLLWQDGSMIRRLEGFSDVESAIDYAEQL